MSETVRWGLLGTSAIAEGVVGPAIRDSRNGRVTAVSGSDSGRTARLAAGLGARAVDGHQALLNDPDVDAVYLSLANALHAPWAIRAAEAGKAVLCEKPMALTLAEAEAVIAAFAATGRPLMEGFMWRFHPQHARAEALLARGVIGDLVEVRVHMSVDLRAERQRGNIRFRPELGGGALLDMGCYCADVLRRYLGGGWTGVSAQATVDAETGVDLSMAGLVSYPGGRHGVMSCSFVANGQGRYELIGTSGVIELPRALIPGFGSRAGEALVITVDADGARKAEVIAPINQYRLMAEAFADAVLAGGPSPIPPHKTLDGPRLVDALRRAAGLSILSRTLR